jgi:S1-C subfamily serine protease
VQVVEGLGGKNGFDPTTIYERLSPGVVTITSLFSKSDSLADVLEGGGAGQGSGFVLDDNGYIATNAHVITNGTGTKLKKAKEVFVQFADGNQVSADIVGYDGNADVGLIKVEPKGLELVPLSLGRTADVRVGEPVAAIGSPFGQQGSLSVGVVSAIGRSIDSLTGTFQVANAIQIDAPINRGNSGGPLFDAGGRVIGINAQIQSSSGTAEGVGFAIPIAIARRSLDQLLRTGRVRYAYIGVRTQDVTPGIAKAFDLGAERGALVTGVEDGTPAASAGIRGGSRTEAYNGLDVTLGGDLIVGIAGKPVATTEDVSRIVTELMPGQTVEFTVIRGGRRLGIDVTLGDRPLEPR